MRYRLRTTVISGGLAALLVSSFGGCAAYQKNQQASADRVEAAAQRAESAATRAENAADRVEDAARRAEQAAQKAEAIFSKHLRK